jgi:hypothetical protein
MSRFPRFVVLYYSHALTTIPVPLVPLALRLVSPLQALSVALFLAGFWTLVGAVSMVSFETRQLRRLYMAFGIALVVVSVLPSLQASHHVALGLLGGRFQ